MKHKTPYRIISTLCALVLLLSSVNLAVAADTSKFSDVKSGNWYFDAVNWAVEHGITSGTSATTFSPNATCNNAQILTFLWRAAGKPSASIANPFRDVSSGDYYYQAALWAYENALVSGGSFNAAVKCTRAMAVTYIWKAKGMPLSLASPSFTDVPAQDYELSMSVAWAQENGVTSGTSKTTFSPDSTCTRAQIVTFLRRAYDDSVSQPVETDYATSFSPVAMKDLANRKSLQKKATDDQLAQAYTVALELVRPLAGLSKEEQLVGIASAIRQVFDNGMEYSMSAAHYNDPYGYFILGSASCAGCTRATGLCLNILGITYEHVNENEYSHQWCRVNVNGTYWICDAYGLYCGPEPAPYTHPYFW